eukprot:PhF_6_TR3481/c0_g1_i1/m.5112/K20003/ZDHHC4, SWF1; palmitoyltransferase ZDHHC4
MYILVIYTIFVCVVFYIMLCGSTRYHRDGFVGRLNDLLHEAPGYFTKLFCIAVHRGRREEGTQAYVALHAKVALKRSPVLQILYCALTFPAIIAYFYFVFPLLSTGSVYFVTTPLAVCVLVASFLIGCKVDPGTIKDASMARAMDSYYPRDDFLYPEPAKDCSTCHYVKPARSKHCSVCDRCVSKFDHHCGWLNTDVGANNMRVFLFFLIAHWFGCGLCSCACVEVIRDYIRINRLYDAHFYDTTTGQSHKASTFVVLRYTMFHCYGPIVVLFFAGCVALLLFGFWCHHMINVLRDFTSNELGRAEDLLDYEEHLQKQHQQHDGGVPRVSQLPDMYTLRRTYFKSYKQSIMEMLFPPTFEGKQSHPQGGKGKSGASTSKGKRKAN